MSMQNLTSSSANFQLFSKALQDAVPVHPSSNNQQQSSPEATANGSSGGGDADHQEGHHHQIGQFSTADLHQLMLSQLDQQLYLSQLSGLGLDHPPNSAASGHAGRFPYSSGDASVSSASNTATDSAATATTTTTSSNSDGQQQPKFGGGGDQQQMTHQKLMEQFLEVATTAAQQQQNGGGGGATSSSSVTAPATTTAEEMMVSQLMAQLVNGSSGNAGGAVDQRKDSQEELQSPTAQQHQQQVSLLEQLQLLQMLGSSGATPNSIPGLSELLAAGGALPSSATSSAESLAQLLKGAASGGSPSKAEQVYCDLCDKWLCNRYFMKTHMLKKHGIGDPTSNTNSPMKSGMGNFSFGPSGHFGGEDQQQHRSQSVSHPAPEAQQRAESPLAAAGARLAPKLSLSSTPGMGANAANQSMGSFEDAMSPEQQQIAMMQQLAAQLGLANGSAPGDGGRNPLLEQIFAGAGLPLAELMGQHQQQRPGSPSAPPPGHASPSMPSLSAAVDHHPHHPQPSGSSIPCSHCPKQFTSQSALFQHQLAEHISGGGGGTDLQHNPSQNAQQNSHDAQQQSINALAMMAAGMGAGGQQQQLFGQLLGSNPFPQGTAPSMLFTNAAAFGGMNPAAADFDGSAMLAKLSAELAAAAAAQGQQAGGQGAQAGQMTPGGGGQGGPLQQASNKPPPQKRQYSSTSKNFCDLCNKEVCNKYFLRTHMLKMHNIIIDENKPLIANIDTVEKERKGEVKFRCDICHASMGTRDELRSHKRETHGMQAGALHTPPSGKGGPKMSHSGGATAVGAMDTMANGGQKASTASLPPFPTNFVEQMRGRTESMVGERGEECGRMAADENGHPQGGRMAPGPDGQNPVKQLLSLIGAAGGDTQSAALGANTGPAARFPTMKNEMMMGDEGELTTGPRAEGADANNNATCCRFCGLYADGEAQLQLHQLMEHPAEYMAATLQQQQQPEGEEDKLVTRVAMQMAEANNLHKYDNGHHAQRHHHHQQHQLQQLRKTSAASSGASSSSGAGSSGAHDDVGISTHPPATAPAEPPQGRRQCAQCKRWYKSEQKLERHQRMVHHHNLVTAKLSPAKRTILSPKKKARLLTSFSCPKCRRRFSTRAECDEHVITHIRKHPTAEDEEEEGVEESGKVKRAKMGEEEEDGRDEDDGRLVVDEAEDEDEEEDEEPRQGGSGEAKNREEEEEDGREEKRRMMGGRMKMKEANKATALKMGGAKEGEKHSHTSGSTSPVSVQAGSSTGGGGTCGGLPEGFAHPVPDPSGVRPFVLQSFMLRAVSPTPPHSLQLPDELVAYLPVRSTLLGTGPVRVTFELCPAPNIDQQVQHL